MIKKERTYPLSALVYEALLRRIPPNHDKRKIIASDLAKAQAGYRGEQSLDYYFSFLPKDSYYIFHDLRLPCKDHYFKVDTLILSPSFILILEVKNISGTLTFDSSFQQLIRSINKVEEAFPDPLTQVKHQKFQLSQWLLKHRFTANIPIYTQVVISNPQAIIKAQASYTQQITRSTNLIARIDDIKKKYPNLVLSHQDLKKITRLLLKEHSSLHINALDRYQINESELIKGVHCPGCFHLPLSKSYGKWKCPHCRCDGKDALKQSLFDYYLILRPTITNTQFREFMLIPSPSVACKLIKSFNLPFNGGTKSRKYHLSLSDFHTIK
ncbi:nuclease-related domain-containing protein [Bacillus sp. JJ722]|uniref:nuclease-related domain-containing protein n=1 Tax=Bacillus sp. JJ722 TaxID=3122973 RepID=UPI002FFE3BE7